MSCTALVRGLVGSLASDSLPQSHRVKSTRAMAMRLTGEEMEEEGLHEWSTFSGSKEFDILRIESAEGEREEERALTERRRDEVKAPLRLVRGQNLRCSPMLDMARRGGDVCVRGRGRGRGRGRLVRRTGQEGAISSPRHFGADDRRSRAFFALCR
eukprot:765329-Hanusia_phi.AAC.3